jgi:hypothetical protein
MPAKGETVAPYTMLNLHMTAVQTPLPATTSPSPLKNHGAFDRDRGDMGSGIHKKITPPLFSRPFPMTVWMI